MGDSRETRTPEDRAAAQYATLRDLLAHAKAAAPGWARLLAEVDADGVTGPEQLAQLPVLRKSALTELQAAEPPFGGLTTCGFGGERGIGHVYMSPGPIFEPGVNAADWWRFERALRAVGMQAGDLVLNCFAYHLTPAGAMFESGAKAAGLTVIPGGTGNSAEQAGIVAALRPRGYTGTPDFLKTILDTGAELGLPMDSVQRALVSGGALFPSLRTEYEERGIVCRQCYGTADVGLVAYESEAMEGMISDEDVIIEIVRPGTGDPVPDGEVGEVVVTTLNREYPLFRFATGDLSAIMPGASPCGRTAPRIKGWMGRADQTTKVRGMFVHPSQVAELVARHPEIGRIRVTVTRADERDVMAIQCETDAQDDGALAERVAESAQAVLKLRGDVALVDSGSLPNDGVVIADERQYGDDGS